MYVTNNRLLNRVRFAGTGQIIGTNVNYHYSTPTVIEGVYSWRTGRRAISDPPVSPPVKGRSQDGFGIYTPSTSGSLVSRLADRKRYMEDFQRAAFPAETLTGSTSVDRTSTTDSGHMFASHKTLRMPMIAHVDYYSATNRWFNGDVWLSIGDGLVNPSRFTFGFPTTVGDLSVSEANRQAMANRYFVDTAPDKNVGSLMTTLIELLRGDIPSILKNFQEMMAGYRTVRNYVGSDALNIMFGWTPLIQEYANLIKVGMNLERVVYYESFRRKRQWEGPSLSSSKTETLAFSMLGAPFSASNRFIETGDVIGGTSGQLMPGVICQTKQVESEDYHFTSRYTGLAKSSRRADSFSDQAADVLKRLGLVDDPQMLWDLTPYSWLVDWFTTMGASISNANVYSPIRGKYDVDYAYLTTQRIYSKQSEVIRPSGVLSSTYRSFEIQQPTSVALSKTRWRDRATPYGFGTQLGSLSASQFAVLVALGLSRRR